jgi:ribosome maturation factor RimP
MARATKIPELIAALEPAAVAHGMALVEVELITVAGQAIVRVYLENSDEQNLVSIDALATANAWVDPLVEAVDPYPGAYTLEVSSPGINRPLRTLRHYERFVGETIKLRTEPINGRSNWTGELAGVRNNRIQLKLENETVEIALEKIKKANVQGSYFTDRKGR